MSDHLTKQKSAKKKTEQKQILPVVTNPDYPHSSRFKDASKFVEHFLKTKDEQHAEIFFSMFFEENIKKHRSKDFVHIVKQLKKLRKIRHACSPYIVSLMDYAWKNYQEYVSNDFALEVSNHEDYLFNKNEEEWQQKLLKLKKSCVIFPQLFSVFALYSDNYLVTLARGNQRKPASS